MKKYFYLSILLLVSFISNAQRTFKHYVRVTKSHCIKEVANDTIVTACKVDSGTTYKIEWIAKTKCCDTLISATNIVSKTYIRTDTTIKKRLVSFDTSRWHNSISKINDKANITISKDTLLLNFWLSGPKKSKLCGVEEDSNALFNTKKKYLIIVENRKSIPFSYRNYEIGALTIPIKIRFGYTENGIKIPSAATSNITNIGTYFGVRFGKVNYWYNKYEEMKTVNKSWIIAGFFGVSNDKVDSLASTVGGINGLKKNDTPRDIVSISYGVSAMFDISDFRFGIVLGWDRAFGDNRKIWNYDNKLWLGIGVGYKLAFLRNPEK